MIIKNLTRKSGTGQLFKYMFRYILEKQSASHDSRAFSFFHNIESRTIDGYVREFKETEARRLHRRKDSVSVHHVIISWSNLDRDQLTPEKISDLCRKYVSLRGENHHYIGAMHTDREHIHLHLAMSGTQLNGKSSRISKEAFAKLKIDLDLYQAVTYPELSHSLPDHGKHRALDQPIAVTDRTEIDREPVSQAVESSDDSSELAELQTLRRRSLETDRDYDLELAL